MDSLFYYDIVCPYAYMAFTYLNRCGLFKTSRLHLKPILLGGLFKEMEVDVDPNRSMPKAKKDYIRADIKRQAAFFDVPLNFHPRHPVSTVNAMRLIHACDETSRLLVTERLYKSYWQDNLDIDDEKVLEKIATDFGIDLATYRGSAKDVLKDATHEAFSNKVFGVPTLALNNRLYFGADRLELIQSELGITLPTIPWSTTETIDFYFDFSSPYSYLAWSEVKKAQSQGVKFNFKPILLGALFKEIGTNNIPMLSAHPNKTAYYMQDMCDWAKYRSVPFKFNSQFPLRTVTPLRVALLDHRAIDPIFAAAWGEDRDVGDKATLTRVLDQAGLAHENLLERSEDDDIKDQLKANTADAFERGVFGVPTFFVRGQQVFGQDRFLWIRQEILRR